MDKNNNNCAFTLICLDAVNSTMEEIKKNKYNSYHEVALLAKIQKHGKGRRNNTWVSEKGNLFLSVKLKDRIKNNHQLTSYMVGIIVYDNIKNYVPKSFKSFIKWPNDIYIENKKISGSLIEFTSSGNNINETIIGIGVNISSCPTNLNKPTTYLNLYTKKRVNIINLSKAILSDLRHWSKLLSYNKEFIIKEWMKRSNRINTKINFTNQNKKIAGIYKGISKDGFIKVLVNNKLEKFCNLELI